MKAASLTAIIHLIEDLLELFGFFEIPVDRRKAHKGDLIQAAQRFHDHLTDFTGENVSFTAMLETSHDAGDDALDALAVHGALVQGDDERLGKLVAVKGLARPV